MHAHLFIVMCDVVLVAPMTGQQQQQPQGTGYAPAYGGVSQVAQPQAYAPAAGEDAFPAPVKPV